MLAPYLFFVLLKFLHKKDKPKKKIKKKKKKKKKISHKDLLYSAENRIQYLVIT